MTSITISDEEEEDETSYEEEEEDYNTEDIVRDPYLFKVNGYMILNLSKLAETSREALEDAMRTSVANSEVELENITEAVEMLYTTLEARLNAIESIKAKSRTRRSKCRQTGR